MKQGNRACRYKLTNQIDFFGHVKVEEKQPVNRMPGLNSLNKTVFVSCR